MINKRIEKKIENNIKEECMIQRQKDGKEVSEMEIIGK